MKTKDTAMKRSSASATGACTARRRSRARSLSSKALSIVMSAILVIGLSPMTKVSSTGADADTTSTGQLPTGTYWYNGDVDFTTIDSSNTFTSSVWDDYRDNGYDGTGNALGIAGSFHLVAFDTLNTAGSHVYGNMLAKNMTGNQDFGTDSRFDDLYGHSTLTYIQNYQGTHSRFGATSFAKQAVVFGSNTDTFSLFSVNENGHDIINYGNTKTSATKVEFPAAIGQDLDSSTTPFININDVKTQAVALSNTLASRSSLGGATFDFSDMNNKQITYTKGSGCAYVELSLSDITSNGNPIRINNVPTDGTGALVINVDCQGSSAAMPDQIILNAQGGKQAGVGEVDSDTGYVLWNFYNASGATITGAAMVSSILAPGATLNLRGNACGTFIADNITVTGETHTRPFHGKFDKGDTTSVSVEKKWLDSKGEAEVDVTHGSITAELWYADASGNATAAVTDASGNPVTVQLSADNGWKYTWGDLPTKKDGQALHYTVKESGLADADKALYDSAITSNGNNFTITNQHKAEVSVSATKKWNDNDNIDKLRPTSVTLNIMRQVDGGAWTSTGETLVLNADNGWAATKAGLPATDANGKEYTYSLQEAEVTGYTGSIESKSSTDKFGNVSYTFAVTNTHQASKVNATVTKAWDDDGNRDGIRAESVSVNLMRSVNGGAKQIVGTKTLSAGNNWTATFEDLPVWGDDGTYAYSIDEVSVAGYTSAVVTSKNSSGNYTFALTNTHEVAKTSVGVHKVWDDSNNADDIRPASVTVQLLANGEVVSGSEKTLSADNGWSATWSNLVKKDSGKAITYTVAEVEDVEGYESSITGGLVESSGTFSYTLTNKHDAAKVGVSVQKTWKNADGSDDASNHDVITVQLYKKVAGGEKVAMDGYTLTLSSDNGWKGSWANLPAKVSGSAIEYSIEEVGTPEGYAASVEFTKDADGNYAYTLTNTKQAGPEKTSVEVTKAWGDANNQDGIRPASVKVQLYADGAAIGDAVELSAANSWKYQWTDLEKNANGKAIAYTVGEVDVPGGYAPSVSKNDATDGTFSYTLTNKHEVATTSVNVLKTWIDANDQDGIRPASVTVQLYANGEALGDAVVLSAANNWSYEWKNLAKNEAGKAINYTVAEVDVPEGYAANVPKNNANDGTFSYVLTNTHNATTTEVNVQKQWLASDGTSDGGEHDAITVQLYRSVDGAAAEAVDGHAVELSAANGWKASWTDLPAKQGGKDVAYSVAEVNVPAGYTSKVTTGEASNSFTVTNTADKKTQVSVTKVWSDDDNADGLRPASVTAQLCTVDAQGTEVPVAGKTVVLSADNNWSYVWEGLDLNDASGNPITYSVQEAVVSAGYEGNVSGGKLADGTFAFTLTNTHERSLTEVTVTKKWEDANDADGLRPVSVTAQLYVIDAQGAATPVDGKTVKLSSDNNWTASWTDLPAKEAGAAIKYTVREVEVPDGYTVDISGVANEDGSFAFTMTNTHEQEEAELSLAGYSVRSISDAAPEAGKVCYVDPKVNKVLIGRALADGEFAFQLIDDATGAVVSATTNDAAGMVDFDKANNVSGDDMNPCCLQFTAAGTYTYTVREDPSKEKDPTIDYSTEVVTFVTTIDEVDNGDGTTSLVEKESKYVVYASAADRAAGAAGTPIMVKDAKTGETNSTVHPTITNSVKAIQLGLTKFGADSSVKLPGAVYGLYRAASVAGEDSADDVLVAKATSDADGHMTFITTDSTEVISTDTDYWFKEISAPEGYKLSQEPTQKFQIKLVGEGEDVKYQLAYADGTTSKEYSIGTVIEFGDGAGVTDEALSVKVNKVDSARQGLAGAKLGVRLADADEALDEWTSNGAGHVLTGLVAGKQYVLYETEVPDGYAKAADVTFAVDESGTISLVENAFAKVNDKEVLNAYATDSQVSLVDYKKSETVEQKVVQRDQAKTTNKTATKSAVKTGDSLPVAAIGAVAIACLAIALAAAFASRRRKGK